MPDGRRWYLKQPLRWSGVVDGELIEIEVPIGFVMDFASVPRPLWWFVSPWGKHGYGAVLHDLEYWLRRRPRRVVDKVFLVAMRERRQLLLIRLVMWAMVRLFGWVAWLGNAHDAARGVKRILAPGEFPAPDAVAPRRGLDRIFAVLCSRFCSPAPEAKAPEPEFLPSRVADQAERERRNGGRS